MEEIIIDLSQVPMTQEDLASLEELISRSKTMGPQIGIPWNEKVYDYTVSDNALELTATDWLSPDYNLTRK